MVVGVVVAGSELEVDYFDACWDVLGSAGITIRVSAETQKGMKPLSPLLSNSNFRGRRTVAQNMSGYKYKEWILQVSASAMHRIGNNMG